MLPAVAIMVLGVLGQRGIMRRPRKTACLWAYPAESLRNNRGQAQEKKR